MAWGDISSDEEEEAPPQVPEPAAAEPFHEDAPPSPVAERPARKPRSREIPNAPPYTANLRNLCFNITQEDDLVQALQDLVAPQTLQIVNVRIVRDHGTGRPRGFGYVQVETPDQLRMLMNLPENVELAGRRLQLDTAKPKGGKEQRGSMRKKGPDGGIDGSKFQGGSFSKKEGAESPKQRPSLLLKPRSGRDMEGSGSNLNASSSSIFGGGKARDEQSWRDRPNKESKSAAEGDGSAVSPVSKGGKPTVRSPGGRSGRGRTEGGRGRGDGGRSRDGQNAGRGDGGRRSGRGSRSKSDGGKGRGDAKATSRKSHETKSSTHKEPDVPKPKGTAVANNFAALAFDSDSE